MHISLARRLHGRVALPSPCPPRPRPPGPISRRREEHHILTLTCERKSAQFCKFIHSCRHLCMRRPVLRGKGARAVHKRRSIPHAKHGFFDVHHLHIGRRCLVVEQGLHNRCNALAVITVCVLAAAEKAATCCQFARSTPESRWAQSCE